MRKSISIEIPEFEKRIDLKIQKKSFSTYLTIETYKKLIKKRNDSGMSISEIVEESVRSYCR